MVSCIKVMWINNDGQGYADYIQTTNEISLAQFVADRGINQPSRYNIRVNRLPAPADQKLHDGDRVSCTPSKVEGAK